MFTRHYVWLIWTQSKSGSLRSLESVNLSIDSDLTLFSEERETLNLYEVFKVHYRGGIIWNHIAKWNPNKGAVPLQEPLKRTDLQGWTLKITAVLADLPYDNNSVIEDFMDTTLAPDIYPDSRDTFRLFSHLKDYLNVSFKSIFTPSWGYPTSDGNYSGVIGMLQRKEVDLSASIVILNEERLQLVDLYFILKHTKICFSFLQPRSLGSFKALLTPLEPDVWIYFLLLSVVFILIYRLLAKYDPSPDIANWGASIVFAIGALTQQGFEDSVKLSSSRLVNFTLLITTYLLFVYYNASVLNSLLSPSPNSILSVEQLINSEMTLGLQDIAYNYDRKSPVNVFGPEGPRRNVLYRQLEKSSKLYYSYEEGVKEIQKGKFAFYSANDQLYPLMEQRYSDAELCSLYHINVILPFPSVFLQQNNSPYSEIFRQSLTLMGQVGLIDRVIKEWHSSKPPCNWRQDAVSIGPESLLVAYIVLVGGIFLCIIVFIFEIMFYKKLSEKVIKFDKHV